jgi:hypothetical protein
MSYANLASALRTSLSRDHRDASPSTASSHRIAMPAFVFIPLVTTAGYALTPGYETYRGMGWFGVIEQQPNQTP